MFPAQIAVMLQEAMENSQKEGAILKEYLIRYSAENWRAGMTTITVSFTVDVPNGESSPSPEEVDKEMWGD